MTSQLHIGAVVLRHTLLAVLPLFYKAFVMPLRDNGDKTHV